MGGGGAGGAVTASREIQTRTGRPRKGAWDVHAEISLQDRVSRWGGLRGLEG